jgi:hypothetical protein
MPLKRSIRLKQSPRSKRSARSKESTRLTTRIVAGSIALALMCVGAVMLSGAPQTSQPADGANAARPSVKPATQAGAKNTAAMAPRPGGVAAETLVADATASNAPAMESTTTANAPKSAPVTITGCLERADETFRLKDTTGVDAPKSRSWKSAFLRRGSAPIEVVDAANRLKLSDHLGQRVSVTGTLVDRGMQVRSLRRVAASCTTGAKESN